MEDLVKQARKDYDEIINGRKGCWFDPGEYEDLQQKWFKKYADQLLKILEEKESQKVRTSPALALEPWELTEEDVKKLEQIMDPNNPIGKLSKDFPINELNKKNL